MFTTIVWLMIVVSVFMVIIVLVQRSKGGGLNQSFASQQQIMGVRKSTDFVEKATWTLACLLLVFSLLSVAFMPSAVMGPVGDSGLDQLLENRNANAPQGVPSFDAQAPVEAGQAGASAENPAEPAPQAEPVGAE